MADVVAVWHPTFVHGGMSRSDFALELYSDGTLRLKSPVPNGDGEVFIAPDALREVIQQLDAEQKKRAESIPVTEEGFAGGKGGSDG